MVINIVDENDNTPRFQEGVYITSIKENIPSHSDVYTVNATDADSGDNGKVVYVLAGGNVDNIQDTFNINSVTGVIQTKVALDRETQDSYSLIIEAHDMVSQCVKLLKYCYFILQILFPCSFVEHFNNLKVM